nr:MAG TPA: hypothetical protein [Caudoviricetes sp.]
MGDPPGLSLTPPGGFSMRSKMTVRYNQGFCLFKGFLLSYELTDQEPRPLAFSGLPVALGSLP